MDNIKSYSESDSLQDTFNLNEQVFLALDNFPQIAKYFSQVLAAAFINNLFFKLKIAEVSY